jgi:hypothetical protein
MNKIKETRRENSISLESFSIISSIILKDIIN